MQLIWFCSLVSGDVGGFYGVWSNNKHCDHIIPFIWISFHLFSMSSYHSEYSLRLGRRLPFTSLQKVNISSLSNYRSLLIFNTFSKIHFFSSLSRFRTVYIPNLIPVSIILLDLNLLSPNSFNVLHYYYTSLFSATV
jgi:hypothetical protein